MQFTNFIQYCSTHITGDEKGEAQIFLDHFFIALGHADGIKGAGADLEFRLKAENRINTNFADLVWKPRVLIEMKKRGEDLSIHYQQAFSYWQRLVPNRPRYVITCNFDEFWIYDFDVNIYEPQEKINLLHLNENIEAFCFLLPVEKKPVFKNNYEDVTIKVAQYISQLYRSLTKNNNRKPKIDSEDAIRYCIQVVLCLFAEDINLLPNKIFTRLIKECLESNVKGFDKVPETYDLIGGLFREMNLPGKTPAGKYKDVDYFNGGLFDKIVPIELEMKEVELLEIACDKKWKDINPAIFGSIFEGNMNVEERHELGAHYTHETDIKRIVDPVIVQPWRQKIDAVLDQSLAIANNNPLLIALLNLHKELTNFKVLDPACGSGNFLFIAYKELKLIEKEIFKHLHTFCKKKGDTEKIIQHKLSNGMVGTKQFYGIDKNATAVELAKVTLMIAKELSINQAFENEDALPLDNLDSNIICADALFIDWQNVDAIIGNPPYQSKRNMQAEFGAAYMNKLYKEFKNKVPARSDFCVYWFYKAHQHLKPNCYAGLVATNTITQNYSREGSLDYIVKNGGTIFSAVSSMKWSGEAAVTVSIACWKKGRFTQNKELFIENKKKQLVKHVVKNINSSLRFGNDVSQAGVLKCNKQPKKVFQGQVPGSDGYLIDKAAGLKLIKQNQTNEKIIKPHLIADELLGNVNSQPTRFMIDFTGKDILEASTYKQAFKILQKKVLPKREIDAEFQEQANADILKTDRKANVNKHHISFLKSWWQPAYGREDMLNELQKTNRYIACSGVSQRNIFEFVSSEIIPNAAVIAFLFNDYYSFGIIQSNIHWQWWKAKCSTFESRMRYTANTVWDTFPFPQQPTQKQVEKIAKAAKALHLARTQTLQKNNVSLRDLYRLLEQPGKNLLKKLTDTLDIAVFEAYNFNLPQGANILECYNEPAFILSNILELNETIVAKEKNKEPIIAPGLPIYIKNKEQFISDDCVKFNWE
jgi:N-6 DNA Methylase